MDRPIVISCYDPIGEKGYGSLGWSYAHGEAEYLIDSKMRESSDPDFSGAPDLISIREDWLHEHCYEHPNAGWRKANECWHEVDVYGEPAILIPDMGSYYNPFDRDGMRANQYVMLKSDPETRWYKEVMRRRHTIKETCKKVASLLFDCLKKGNVDHGRKEVLAANGELYKDTYGYNSMPDEPHMRRIAVTAEKLSSRRFEVHELARDLKRVDDPDDDCAAIMGEEWVKSLRIECSEEFKLLPASIRAQQLAERETRRVLDVYKDCIHLKDESEREFLHDELADAAASAASEAVRKFVPLEREVSTEHED